MYPALASQFILLMLATSIVSQISAPDLFHTASIIQSRTFRDFEVYIVVAAALSRARAGLPPRLRGPLPAGLRAPMIREFAAASTSSTCSRAARWTVALTPIAFLGGGLVGLVDRAAARRRRSRRCAGSATVYVQVDPGHAAARLAVRVLLRPAARRLHGLAWIAAAAAFSIYAGAFLGEIWRGCLQAIPRTQWEAGASLGLGFTAAAALHHRAAGGADRHPADRRLPGAARSRTPRSPPSIGFVELTREGQITTASTFRPFTVYPHRRRDLFRAVLPADAVEPRARAEAPCRSLSCRDVVKRYGASTRC